MKPTGTKFEYEHERDNDLMSNYHQLVANSKHVSMPHIYRQLVDMPAQRFWVSEERAAIVISQMMKGCDLRHMRPLKREMYQEIYRRVMIEKKRNPTLTISKLVAAVVEQPAPKFYLTPGSAKVLICKIRKEWYFQRTKRRLRHLY